MATVYCTVNGIVRSSTETAEQTAPPGGSVATVIAEYEASSLATAQTIDICTIPPYSRYRLVQVTHVPTGAGASLIVGASGATSRTCAANSFRIASTEAWSRASRSCER